MDYQAAMQLIFVANMDADEVLPSLTVIRSVVAFMLLNATTDIQYRPISGTSTTYVYQVLAMVVTFRILHFTDTHRSVSRRENTKYASDHTQPS